MGHVRNVSRPTIRGRRPSVPLCAAATALLSFWTTTTAGQQRSELTARLEQLNVRVETEHYVLAGTVSDLILEQCGQQLESIHREYAALFDQVLADEKKSAGGTEQPGQDSTGGKGSSTPKGKPTTGGPGKATPNPAGAGRPGKTDPPQNPPAGRPVEKPPSKGTSGKQKPGAPAESGGRTAVGADGKPVQTIDQDDPRQRFRVLVFATRDEYDSFLQEFRLGRPKNSIGLYVGSLRLLLITDEGNPDDTGGVLFHEACHQFVRRYLKDAPPWLNEGLATYFDSARGLQGRLKLEPDRSRWRLCRKAINAGCALSVDEVLLATSTQFHDSTPVRLSDYHGLARENLFYAQSYTLVHLLLSRPDGRERLRGYIRALAKAPAPKGAAITNEFFGPDARAALAQRWTEYVQSYQENE